MGGRFKLRAWKVGAVVCATGLALSMTSLAATASAGLRPHKGKYFHLLPANIQKAGVITVLTDPEFNPISYYKAGSTTDIIGSDPDILRAMGTQLGVTIKFIPVAFTGMLTGVASARGEVAGGGLTDTVSRESGGVNFVDDFSLGELYVVKKGSTLPVNTNPLSACGLKVSYTIGALSATTQPMLSHQCVLAGKPAMQLVGFSDINATLLGVLSGRVDVAPYDNLGFAAVNKADHYQFEAFKLKPYPNQYWGFAVSKKDYKLAYAMLLALKAIVANGQYASILNKYGVSTDALNTPGINLQKTHPQPL